MSAAAGATFSRFFPNIKARYDYGVVIFILTFSLVTISGYRVDEIVQMAHQRLTTIIIGGATCMFIALFVCPVWAGQDLHLLVSLNMGKLASYLEGTHVKIILIDVICSLITCLLENSFVLTKKLFISGFGGECFGMDVNGERIVVSKDNKSFLQAYKSVLNSKTTEETLVS